MNVRSISHVAIRTALISVAAAGLPGDLAPVPRPGSAHRPVAAVPLHGSIEAPGARRRLEALLERGLRESSTFAGIARRALGKPGVELSVRFARNGPGDPRARSALRVVQTSGALRSVEGTVHLPSLIAPDRLVALLGHELHHVANLRSGSRDESPGSAGEIEALRAERCILSELSGRRRARRCPSEETPWSRPARPDRIHAISQTVSGRP